MTTTSWYVIGLFLLGGFLVGGAWSAYHNQTKAATLVMAVLAAITMLTAVLLLIGVLGGA